jgi:predicted Zn-dependent peptidase
MREKPISDSKLEKYKKQFLGQLAISAQNKENTALGMGKSFLHFNRIETMEEVRRKIENITAKQLQDIANEVFAKEKISTLVYS